ncbi:hypothetical protein EYR36_005821 [Pleurotus pulmonarius]|nr:hypothetical protein EYR36_005821 [Pleurotus pulmonarius]
MAKSDKKAVKVDKKVEKADKKAKSADSKPKTEKPAKATTPNKPLSTKEILSKVNGTKKADKKKAEAVAPPKSNGKAKEPSSDEDSESDSEDEKPKAAQIKAAKAAESSSDSDSDSDDDAPPPPKKAATSKPAKVASPAKAAPAKPTPVKAAAQAKKADSSSSESDSESESESEKKPAPPTKTPKSKVAKPVASKAPKAPSSDDSSDSSSSEDEAPAKPTPAKVAAAKAPVPSSSSDSDSSDEEESKPTPAKKAAPTKEDSSDSDSDSSSEDEPAKPTTAVKAKPSDSSDSSSDDDSDVEMDDSTKSKPAVVTNGKRKADDETAAPPKKIKMANGDAAPAGDAEGETKTIFVGQLSWNTSDDQLAEAFAECGEIVSATVQTDRNTGRSRGFGYVHFADASAVEKALAMNGTELDGRNIKVDKSQELDKSKQRENRAKAFGDSTSPPSQTLFVGNLSFGVSEDSLWEFFGEYGSVKNVRLPTDRESGRPKGFGYVEFDDVESATKAYEGANGQEIEGRSIRLDYSQPRDNSGGFGGGRGGGRGGFGGDRGGRGGRGGGRGGRGGFGDRGAAEEDVEAVVDSVVAIVALETVGADGDVAVLLAVVPALAVSLRSKVRRLPLTNCASMFVSLYLLACWHSFIYLL